MLVLGGVRSSRSRLCSTHARSALDAGARGVVYGRNVWQADDPVTMRPATGGYSQLGSCAGLVSQVIFTRHHFRIQTWGVMLRSNGTCPMCGHKRNPAKAPVSERRG